MRAFVTGGTGFLGGALARALRGRGDAVVALVRSPERAAALRGLGCELVAGDLSDVDAIRRGVEGCDAAFHVAALYRIGVSRRERAAMVDANVHGTERVLDAATEAGAARIVYVSTNNVVGNTRGRIVDEGYERPPGPFLSAYDETKLRAHEAARERIRRGAPVVIVQPGAIYGPGDTSQFGAVVARAARGRLPAVAFADLGLVLCHVDDVVAGILLAHDRGRVGETYVLGGEVATLGDAVARAAAVGGRRPPRFEVPRAPLRLAARLSPRLAETVRATDGVTYWASDEKARRELGYAPRDLATGLRQTLAGAA